jgi:hypothetical protein
LKSCQDVPWSVEAACSRIKTELQETGWTCETIPDGEMDILEVLSELGASLGKRVTGRDGMSEEVIVPRTIEEGRARSLSALHGRGCLPLHVELSHRVRPCRYVLLGCLDPGDPAVATTLLDWRALDFTDGERCVLRSAPILVRTGRRSFYSTILPPGGEYLRFDQECMEPADERGRGAMHLLERKLAKRSPWSHMWQAGDILIIDNWRVLHGRQSATASAGRRLARVLIDD